MRSTQIVTTGAAQTVAGVARTGVTLVQNEGPGDIRLAGAAAELPTGVLLPAGSQATICLADAAWPVLIVKGTAGTLVTVNRVG